MKKIMITLALLVTHAGFAMDSDGKPSPKRLKVSTEELVVAATLANQLTQAPPSTHNNSLRMQHDISGINDNNRNNYQTALQNGHSYQAQPQGNYGYANRTTNNNATTQIKLDDYIVHDQTVNEELNLEKWNILNTGKHTKNYQCLYDHPEWPGYICCKEFLSKSHAKRHQKTHTGLKPYECRLCGIPASQIESIRKHIKEFHLDELYGNPQI